MFQDPEYVKWANEETVHVLSYSIDLNAERPEPLAEVERDGEKVTVLAMYPMFTETEVAYLVNETNVRVKFPEKTPWSGVLSPDGTTVLAEIKKAPAKEFRALFDEQQKKIGKPLARAAWLEANRLLTESSEAEVNGEWGKAVKAVLGAKTAVRDCPKPLADRIEGQREALDNQGLSQIRDAEKAKDPAKRRAELGRIAADFKGLPAGTAAETASAAK